MTVKTSKVSIVKCAGYEQPQVEKAVRRSVELLGGINHFVKSGQKVLVKPNMLMAAAPEEGITTHPEVLRSVIRLLKDAGCRILVGDEPSTWNHNQDNVDNAYAKTGIKQVCAGEGVELIKFEKRSWKGKFPLFSWVDEADAIINVPKFKTHQLTTLTGAVKNLYGFVSGTYKAELHKLYFRPEEFAKILADIHECVRPALSIVDGIVAMEGDGPASSGKLRQMGLVVSGNDCVAVDSVLLSIMGVKPQDVFFIQEATGKGLGVSNLEEIELLGEPLSKVIARNFLLPCGSIVTKLPVFAPKLLRFLIRIRPKVLHDKCVRCASCAKICPQKVISIKDKVEIDHRGCISCFCCQEVCPAAAIKAEKSLMARILGL